MKEGCLFVLFCLYLWDPSNWDAYWDASDCDHGLFGKLSTRRGALALFHVVWNCVVEVLEYWMIFLLKIKLNCSWKFQRNWNVLLVLLERSWWAGFNGIYLVRFGFRLWQILILKWFLPLKIQINSKVIQKNRYIHCKTIFTCWVSLFCNGPMVQATLVLMKQKESWVTLVTWN